MQNTLLPNLVEGKTLVWVLALLDMVNTPIAIIQYESLNFTRKFNDYDELSFSVPRYLYDRLLKTTINNTTWFRIKAGLRVELQIFEQNGLHWTPLFRERFAVQQPSLSESRNSNSQQWNCIALHQLLFNKIKLRGYDDTRKLVEAYKRPNIDIVNNEYQRDSDGNIIYTYGGAVNASENEPYQPQEGTYDVENNTQGGILDYVLDFLLPDWKIVYYDKALLDISQQGLVDWLSAQDALIATFEDYNDKIKNDWLAQLKTNSQDLEYYLRGTKEDLLTYRAAYQDFLLNLGEHLNSANGLTQEYTVEILEEPLKGAYLLAEAEQTIVVLQEWARTLASYQYTERGYEIVYTDTNSLMEIIKKICKFLLEDFIEPLSIYKSATGSVPYRTLKLDTTLVDVFKQLEDNYLCVFDFDNVEKTIRIFSRKNVDINKVQSLIISPDNIMTDISYQASTDQVITRLYAKGKDDLGLAGYNATGLNYVDNFDYYKDNDFMPDTLKNKLEYYQNLIDDIMAYQDVRNTGTADLTDYRRNLKSSWLAEKSDAWFEDNFLIHSTLFAGTDSLDFTESQDTYQTSYTIKRLQEKWAKNSNYASVCQSLARQYQIVYYSQEPTFAEINSDDSWWQNNVSRASITAATTSTLKEIQTELETYLPKDLSDYPDDTLNVTAKIWQLAGGSDTPNNNFYLLRNNTTLEQDLTTWQKELQYANIFLDLDSSKGKLFTDNECEQLLNYIYEEDITWSSITEADALYLYAREYLEYLNKIPITLNLGTTDILSNYRYQFDWSKIMDVGSYLYIDFQDYQLNYDLFKLLSYTYSLSPTSKDLQLTLSNTYDLQNDLNAIVADVWAYSYKQLQDISEYKESWESFIAKEDALILQGQQIHADVSAIVDDAGKTVIGKKGITTSSTHYNAFRKNSDGYYVRDKTISSTKANPNIPANTKLIPDHIVFEGATLTYTPSAGGEGQPAQGETILTVSGIGGGGDAGSSGLPRYYSAPYFSERLQALDARRSEQIVIESGMNVVYYQEFLNGELTWYRATLTNSETQKTDSNNNPIYQKANGEIVTTATEIIDGAKVPTTPIYNPLTVQARDFYGASTNYAQEQTTVGNLLWWTELKPIGTDNRKMMQYTQPSTATQADNCAVMIYKVTSLQPLLHVYRKENTHLPMLQWGLGNGNGDQGKGYVEKVENGLDIYYITRAGEVEELDDGSQKGDALAPRARGIAIRDSGIYQIRNSDKSGNRALALLPIFHIGQDVSSCVSDATSSGLNVEKGDIFIVSQSL